MKIYSVTDKEFVPYGRVVHGFEDMAKRICAGLDKAAIADNVEYIPADPELFDETAQFTQYLFGGMPCQLGRCSGRNTRLNCLEYHRDSEFNLACDDFVLLLARIDDICDGVLDTAKVMAFRVPAGVMVEVYATSLHYAPCHTDTERGFKVLIALPLGTNTNMEIPPVKCDGDKLLWARNKWLLAHPASPEAQQGAYIGLVGENIDISL